VLLALLLIGLGGSSACVSSRGPEAGASSPAEGATPDPSGPPAEDEAALMTRLRSLVDPRPAEALELVRLGGRRYPAGSFADERSLLAMRALVHLDRIAAARDEAVLFFQRFPESRLAGAVSRLTGVHPRPRPGP
jgi:hypothetical protein